MTNARVYDAIVIGVGGMGSAALYQLANRGLRVLGLERFRIAHERGSSPGITRINRLAFHEGPEYVPLGRRAYELWRELEKRASGQVLHITGSVHAGVPGAVAFENTLRACREQDVPHEVLTSAELSKRFPGYALPPEMTAVVQPQGGFLTPERCVESHVAVARAYGAEVHEEERVLDWEALSGGVRVRTEAGVYEAGSLVLTAGAWAGRLVPELAQVAVPERQVMAWFEPDDPALFAPSGFPVFIVTMDGDEYYGFPEFGVPGLKLGKFDDTGVAADPDALDRTWRSDDEEMLRGVLCRCFPRAAGRLLRMAVCMFTNSPDRHFIIGTHAQWPQVSFAAGFSGHGFKFSSVIGEIMADLAERGESRHDISLFAPSRFTS
ncbi:MAG: N-methyl-L-tryptophan oxidase [Chloroflexi bacterium]|nr:N-methyl-L-tryptophan oxidase [Chloroflexota bacterium]